ncbi:hypothetical protein U714_08835 [Rhodobacter capsulatus DE442]|nr:hypothetical protein U714_08835 [Rhodobacter capsulatus DE442]
MAAIAGVISALILARLICWATCGLPEPKAPMSAEEGAALRRAVPAAAPTAAVKVAEAPKPAPKAAEPVKAAPVAAPVKTPEPVAAVAEAPKPAAKPAPAPAPKGKSKPRRG